MLLHGRLVALLAELPGFKDPTAQYEQEDAPRHHAADGYAATSFRGRPQIPARQHPPSQPPLPPVVPPYRPPPPEPSLTAQVPSYEQTHFTLPSYCNMIILKV